MVAKHNIYERGLYIFRALVNWRRAAGLDSHVEFRKGSEAVTIIFIPARRATLLIKLWRYLDDRSPFPVSSALVRTERYSSSTQEDSSCGREEYERFPFLALITK